MNENLKGNIYAFDYLRSISITGILICHYLFNWYLTFGLGRFFGCTFNALFIGMSGLLLGMRWHSSGRKELSFSYLKHRFGKLARTYYPFLVLMFLFLTYVDGYSLSTKNIVTHLLFLPWIDKLPGFEHLWFMTMIAVCYVAIYILSKLKHIDFGWKSYVVISVIVCAIHTLLLKMGLPGQMLLYLWLFILCFYHSNDIRAWCDRRESKIMTMVYVIMLMAIVALFCFGLYDKYRLVGEWLGVLAAALIAVIILSTCRNAKGNQMITFVAGISFELYLVHHVMAFGRWSITAYLGNPILGLAVYFLCSFLMAYLLKTLCNSLSVLLKAVKFVDDKST